MDEELNNLNTRIDFERLKLDRINKIQDEINTMNQSLNNCIDIAYTSKIAPSTKSNYEHLKDEINESHKRTNEDLNLVKDITKVNINNLLDTQDDMMTKERENQDNEEKEDN